MRAVPVLALVAAGAGRAPQPRQPTAIVVSSVPAIVRLHAGGVTSLMIANSRAPCLSGPAARVVYRPESMPRHAHLRVAGGVTLLIGVVACADLRSAANQRCGTFSERCPAPPDTALVNAI